MTDIALRLAMPSGTISDGDPSPEQVLYLDAGNAIAYTPHERLLADDDGPINHGASAIPHMRTEAA